ncbi:hypothetical protein TNCV_3607321 [Trichonephila clavipes]|nr:hypothetical protein TNCV_3607321 [Trichonephila clavipes]
MPPLIFATPGKGPVCPALESPLKNLKSRMSPAIRDVLRCVQARLAKPVPSGSILHCRFNSSGDTVMSE